MASRFIALTKTAADVPWRNLGNLRCAYYGTFVAGGDATIGTGRGVLLDASELFGRARALRIRELTERERARYADLLDD